MDHVDARSRRGDGKTNQGPTEIGRRVRWFGHVSQTSGRGGLATQRDDLERLTEGKQRRHQLMDVAAHACRRRDKGAAVDADTKAAHPVI